MDIKKLQQIKKHAQNVISYCDRYRQDNFRMTVSQLTILMSIKEEAKAALNILHNGGSSEQSPSDSKPEV